MFSSPQYTAMFCVELALKPARAKGRVANKAPR